MNAVNHELRTKCVARSHLFLIALEAHVISKETPDKKSIASILRSERNPVGEGRVS